MNLLIKIYDHFSYIKRREKDFYDFKRNKEIYFKMSDDEFTFEYIDVLTKYKNKKTVLSVLLISLISSILMGIWTYFFDVINTLLSIGYSNTSQEELAVAGIIVCLVLGFILVFLCFIIISSQLISLKKLSNKKVFLEQIKEDRR